MGGPAPNGLGEADSEFESSPFTPRNSEKPLPPSPEKGLMDPLDLDAVSPPASFHPPMLWTTPPKYSTSLEKALPSVDESFDSLMKQSKMVDHSDISGGVEWSASSLQQDLGSQRRTIREEPNDSPLSLGSSQSHCTPQGSAHPSDASTRFSSSTLASSSTQTNSDSSAAASPSMSGFAFGSPGGDKEKVSRMYGSSAEGSDSFPVGLGLSAKDPSANDGHQHAVVPKYAAIAGPYSHHRAPSWTLAGRAYCSSPMATGAAESGKSDAHLPLAPHSPLGINVPSRSASRLRNRSNSSASSTLSALGSAPAGARSASKGSVPMMPTRSIMQTEATSARPATARSMSTNSVTSSTTDTSFCQFSPRTSSLKRSKSRPALVSKTSEPILSKSLATKATFQGVDALDGLKDVPPLIVSTPKGAEALAKADLYCSPEILEEYFAATVPDDLFYSQRETTTASPGLAVTIAEEGKGVMVFAEGKSLQDIQEEVGQWTTHMVLAGCQDADMLQFLEETLPLVGDHLLVLDVSNTKLTCLPASLGLCASLEELNISGNSFDRPWKSHGVARRLSNLRVLLADNCHFSMIPREFGDLGGLKTLSLEGNELTHLPSWLYRLDGLERLLLDGNPFQGAWKSICEAFAPLASGSRQLRGDGVANQPRSVKDVASAPSRVVTFPSQPSELQGEGIESSYEEMEEMEEMMPSTAPVTDSLRFKKDQSARRPLMRRMLSSNMGDAAMRSLSGGSAKDDEASPPTSSPGSASNSRRPSLGAEGVEKKWGVLIRKLGRKASNSTLMASSSTLSLDTSGTSASPSRASSPERSLSKPAVPFPLQNAKVICPLTPVGWHDDSSDSRLKKRFGNGRASVRSSFLHLSHDWQEADQRRKVRALMQYLHDLDDLRALRLGPPGSVLPLETSMASRYSSPAKGTPSSMSRSGSETSPASSHSDHSSSLASDAGYPVRQDGKDDAQRRLNIIQEIIATEISYIRGLQELVEIYVVPSASMEAGTGQPLVPFSERRKVFGNIEGILHFHKGAFLPALQSAAQPLLDGSATRLNEQQRGQGSFDTLTVNVAERVAAVFSRHAAFFRMYSAYVNNVDAAQARVALWKVHKSGNGAPPLPLNQAPQQVDPSATPALTPKERKRIRAFLQRARADLRHTQLSLETYLHLPVQRIPRYRLLLEDLVRSCPAHRLKEATSLSSALESICSIATSMNESKRQSEKDRRLLEWQARIRGNFPSPLVQPHRRLIRDGRLTLKRVVMRTTAFHMSRSQLLEEESRESIECDGAVTDTDLGIVQVDCLDQQCMEKRVSVLLCNDITVVVVEEAMQQYGNQVDLFAVLRIQGNVQVLGQTTLRVVDPKHILYFSVASADEARDWQEAMTQVKQEPRIAPSSNRGTGTNNDAKR